MALPELAAELQKPAYTGLTDAEAAAINSATVSREREVVDAYLVWEAIVPAEWAALTATERQRVQQILGMGRVNLRGANTRASLAAAFGSGATTRSNLVALQTETLPLPLTLGYSRVEPGHVAKARALIGAV